MSPPTAPPVDYGDAITTDNLPPRYPRTFWVALAAGWAMIAFGLRGLARTGPEVGKVGFARVFVGAAILHDLILAPVVIAIGVLVARVAPRNIRSFVQSGLIISGCVILFAFPFVRGYGRQVDNPTVLPRNYATGLTVVLVAVWLGIAVIAAAVTLWRRRRPSPDAT